MLSTSVHGHPTHQTHSTSTWCGMMLIGVCFNTRASAKHAPLSCCRDSLWFPRVEHPRPRPWPPLSRLEFNPDCVVHQGFRLRSRTKQRPRCSWFMLGDQLIGVHILPRIKSSAHIARRFARYRTELYPAEDGWGASCARIRARNHKVCTVRRGDATLRQRMPWRNLAGIAVLSSTSSYMRTAHHVDCVA